MITLSTGRKALSALVVAATVAVALSPASAFAKGGHGHGGRGHYGYGAAALAGGLILGAIAASANDYDEEAPNCWVEKRTRVNAYGDVFVQKVRVCD